MLTHQMYSTKLFSVLLAAAVGVVSLEAPVARAQDENSRANEGVLDEVVVTAQRRSQSLQDVPVSIETFTGDEMTREGLRAMTDLSTFAPGLVVRNQAEEQGLILRGAGTQGKNVGLEAGVPVFVDGIHFGRASSLKGAFLDVEQVEVLRGPQPVFFGQNASAGAVNIRSRRPGPEWSGKAVAEYGNYGRQSIEASIGGPISETFGIRLAGKYDRLEGWMRDWLTGGRFPQQEFKVGRVTLQWTPTDRFQVTTKVEAGEEDFGPRPNALVRDKFDTNINLASPDSIYVVGSPSVNAQPLFDAPVGEVSHLGIRSGPLYLTPTGYTQANSRDTGAVFDLGGCRPGAFAADDDGIFSDFREPDLLLNCEFAEGSGAEPWNALLDATYTFENGIELQSLTGLSHQSSYTIRNSGGPVNANLRYREEDFDQWSTELRLTSPTGGRFEWMTGLYYQNNDLEYAVNGWRANNRVGIKASRSTEKAKWLSGFATVTYNFLDDRFSLDVGARFTDIQKDGTGRNMPAELIVLSPITGEPVRLPYGRAVGDYPEFFGPDGQWQLWSNARVVGRGPYGDFSPDAKVSSLLTTSITNNIDDTSFDPQIVFRYRPSDDLSFYAKYATSYKAGGFDMSVTAVPEFAQDFAFGPETAESYEIGARGTFLDGRARAEVTLFTTTFNGLQVAFVDRARGDINITKNVAEQRSRGMELSADWLVNERLKLGASLALLDAEIRSFPDAVCSETEMLLGQCIDGVIDRSGQPARNAPDWQGFVKADYDLFTNETYRINFSSTVTFSDGYITDRAWATVMMMDKETDMNASLSVDIADRWNVLFWGRNLFGSYKETYFPDNDSLGDSGILFVQVPSNAFATYGLQIGYNFFMN